MTLDYALTTVALVWCIRADSPARRTGVQLKDTGVRDENGLEPLPSFSSPQKGAPTTNGVVHEDDTYTGTYTADDSMDVDQSTF